MPDNDDESGDPDGDGNADGDYSDIPDGGADDDSNERMTTQEAIATLNNLLAMCGSVTKG